jgi:ribosomal protein S6--L-glutamate ligase
MTIHFLIARRVPDVPSPLLAAIDEGLQRRGYDVDATIAEEEVRLLDGIEPDHDLYVLKSHTPLSLSIAGVLHARGARIVNPYPACVTVQNKFLATRVLADAGVPTPRTWVIGDAAAFEHVLSTGPLIVKPFMGHHGRGVCVVRDLRSLAANVCAQAPALVQEYIPGPGEDLKVYVVGDQVFAVRKRFSEMSFSAPGRPVPVDDEVTDIALRAGSALGLGLYGLDVIESPAGPVVVDANYFPGYKGVPGAAARIADYIDAYALGEIELATSLGAVGARALVSA